MVAERAKRAGSSLRLLVASGAVVLIEEQKRCGRLPSHVEPGDELQDPGGSRSVASAAEPVFHDLAKLDGLQLRQSEPPMPPAVAKLDQIG